MTSLPLVIAPDPIFSKKSERIDAVTEDIRQLMDDLLDTIHQEHGVGIAATMVGILKRVVVIDLQENGNSAPLYLANPEIISISKETQTFKEGSLCFLGIAAEVTRPAAVTVRYLDYQGTTQELRAEGFLAACLQHEIDYLEGITFLDYLSPLKRDMLIRKMLKFKKSYHPHVHGAGCNH
jgi:peptide deformylase